MSIKRIVGSKIINIHLRRATECVGAIYCFKMVCKNFFHDDKDILQNDKDGKLETMRSINGVPAIITAIFDTQDGAGPTMTGKCLKRNDIGGEGGKTQTETCSAENEMLWEK